MHKVLLISVIVNVILCFGKCDEDLYGVLGVGRRASLSEIRRAYRAAAKEWHPDKNKDPQAGEKFTKINEAYETLMDSEKRAEYDKYGRTSANQGQSPGGGQGFQGFPGGFGSFQSFFSDGPFRGFNFNFGDDVESNVDKYRITLREYETKILPDSSEKPYILYAYRDFCHQCAYVEKHWDNIVHDLEYIGMGVGAVNVQLDRQLTGALRVSHIPSIMAVINGKVTWMSFSRFDMKSFKGFLRSLFDPSLATEVTNQNIDSFLGGWRNNKVQALFSFNRAEPSLRYLVAAFAFKKSFNVGYINTDKDSSSEVVNRFDIDTDVESLLIFKEDESNPEHMYMRDSLTSDFITSSLESNKYLTLPRLSSQAVFESLCPPNTPRNNRHICIILLSRRKPEDLPVLDNFRQYARKHTHQRLKFAYVYEETQQEFVSDLTRGTGAYNDTQDSLKVAIVWRKEPRRLQFDFVTDGWSSSPKPRIKSKLATDIDHLLQGSGGLSLVMDMQDEIDDEFKPSLPERIVARLKFWKNLLQEKILRAWYHTDEVTVIMIAMTLTFMVVIALFMRTSTPESETRSYSTPINSEARRRETINKTSPSSNGSDSEPTVYLHPLCQDSFGRLVTDLKPGMRTVLILVDMDSRDRLLKDFVTVMYRYSRAHAFYFSFLQLEQHLNWYRTLLETTLDFRRDLKNINKRNCIGTVIAINGFRKYYHIYHAQRDRRSIEGDFIGFGDNSDSEVDDSGAEKLFHADLLMSLGQWMEKLCEGTEKRFRVDYWPTMEAL